MKVTLLLSLFALASIQSVYSAPYKFMCDMCESSFMHCIMKCGMEEYMTRHMYNR